MIASALVLAVTTAAAPHRDAPRPYDVQSYRLEVRLQNDGSFENTEKITLTPSRALTSLELDSFGLDIQKASLDGGGEVSFTQKDDPTERTGLLTLKLKKALAARKPATLVIQYKGKAGTANQGFFTVKDPQDDALKPYFFTHFEPDGARRFFPCNDRIDDKASFELFAIVDAQYQVLSNGKKTKDETYSDKGENLRRVEWKQDQAIAPYTVAMAVGQFEPDKVVAAAPSTLWLQPGRQDRAFPAENATEHAISYEQHFVGVKYPWAKFDQVAVPRFTWGGMENTSLVLMRDSGLVLEEKNHLAGKTRVSSLIAHELAHQWFGDYVTPKSWADIWLNEGFATYLTWKEEDDYYDSEMVNVNRAIDVFVDYFRLEDGPRSHPLVVKQGDPRLAFDGISYVKGAHVLRMLEGWVGEEKFKAGIKAYLEKYALQNASSQDFFATFTKATGTEKELRGFQKSWLDQRGYPVVTPEYEWNGQELVVTLRQKPNHADERGPFVFKLPVVFHRDESPTYEKKEVILVDKPVVTVRIPLPAAPRWVNWNEDGLALAKIDSTAIGEQQWVSAARNDPDPVWRTMAAFTLMGELVNPDAKEMKVPSGAAMDAIQHVLTKDESAWVRTAVLKRLAHSQWKKLPSTLGATVLELAKMPSGLGEDALGVVAVRCAALEALGKIDFKEGHKYVYERLLSNNIDLNYLPAAAIGTANVGDSEALATLRAAVTRYQGKSYPRYKAAASALGAVTSPEVVPVLEQVLKSDPGNNELLTGIYNNLDDNRFVTGSPQFAKFVQRFVVESPEYGEDVKSLMLRRLDDVKTTDARDALLAIREKADSAQLQASAEQVLSKNFPASLKPAKTNNVKPAKGKKKK